MMRQPHVIAIVKCDEVAASIVKSSITCGIRTAIFLSEVLHGLFPLSCSLPHEMLSIVCAAVIDHDQFPVSPLLTANRRQRLGQEARPIISGQYDADFARARAAWGNRHG